MDLPTLIDREVRRFEQFFRGTGGSGALYLYYRPAVFEQAGDIQLAEAHPGDKWKLANPEPFGSNLHREEVREALMDQCTFALPVSPVPANFNQNQPTLDFRVYCRREEIGYSVIENRSHSEGWVLVEAHLYLQEALDRISDTCAKGLTCRLEYPNPAAGPDATEFKDYPPAQLAGDKGAA